MTEVEVIQEQLITALKEKIELQEEYIKRLEASVMIGA